MSITKIFPVVFLLFLSVNLLAQNQESIPAKTTSLQTATPQITLKKVEKTTLTNTENRSSIRAAKIKKASQPSPKATPVLRSSSRTTFVKNIDERIEKLTTVIAEMKADPNHNTLILQKNEASLKRLQNIKTKQAQANKR